MSQSKKSGWILFSLIGIIVLVIIVVFLFNRSKTSNIDAENIKLLEMDSSGLIKKDTAVVPELTPVMVAEKPLEAPKDTTPVKTTNKPVDTVASRASMPAPSVENTPAISAPGETKNTPVVKSSPPIVKTTTAPVKPTPPPETKPVTTPVAKAVPPVVKPAATSVQQAKPTSTPVTTKNASSEVQTKTTVAASPVVIKKQEKTPTPGKNASTISKTPMHTADKAMVKTAPGKAASGEKPVTKAMTAKAGKTAKIKPAKKEISKEVDAVDAGDIKQLKESDWKDILARVKQVKVGNHAKINGLRILRTRSSNVGNAFDVATYLRSKGFIIEGRDLTSQVVKGCRIDIYKNLIFVTIGNY